MVRDSEGLDSRAEIEEVTVGDIVLPTCDYNYNPKYGLSGVKLQFLIEWDQWQGTFSSIPLAPID